MIDVPITRSAARMRQAAIGPLDAEWTRTGQMCQSRAMPATFRHPSMTVSLVAVPEVSAFVMYGLHEIFSYVGVIWEQITGQPSHARQITPTIVAKSRRMFRTRLGVPISADSTFDDELRTDIIIVADLALQSGVDPRGQWPEACDWLREQHRHGAIICSVCTGAVMLAEADLLNGCEATSHWATQQVFAECYPQVKLRTERILSPTGPEHRIVTTGGSASWTDLTLYLIARFCGQDEARRIAKIFLFGDRSEGQLPFAAMARPKQHHDATVAECQTWIAEHYALPNPVHRMVEQSGLASRTFKRRFNNATGYAPLDYVQTLRVEEAKQMLEASSDPIDTIAISVGYDDPNSFRRLFKRTTGISPSQYRQRFQTVSIS